jgi:hypothetical protein
MRTTINLPDDLLAQMKGLAAASNRTLASVVEEALRESLARRRRGIHAEPLRLTTFGGTGVQGGVDLDDAASLLDLMEAPGDSDGR